ncbi:DNA polymerase III subunit alpha [Caballeronia choica]|uniref:DNA polymerase III subunit alpha n=1 Tax=Caballeronia choica TaxID=326476 RepID=A0A158KS59_9BURK|nr:DNA polymerase III subunit alpha [Caballeronia choica]
MPEKALPAATPIDDDTPMLGAPSEAEDIVGDDKTTELTLGRHPLKLLLRPVLLEQRLIPTATLRGYRNGRLAPGCGLVTVNQRPSTAMGVMFVAIEDQTGNVNVVVWPSLLKKQRREALGASLLAVYGMWQCEGDVRQLVAQRLVDMSRLLGVLSTVSRNFC